MQLGIGKIALRLVLGALQHRFERLAAALFACPFALRFGCGLLLALRLGFRFGLGLQPLHGGLNRGQALLPTRQLDR